MAKTQRKPEDFIAPLIINGLQGRVMHLPAPSKELSKEILILYGHHSSLERWWGLAQVFNKYGAVTMPDLPGFGGMDSMYRIGRPPSLDNLADYLAVFVKMRYKRRRLVIVGVSFGFLVATRMLQRYPDLAKKVDFVVSAAGFAHKDDFRISAKQRRNFKTVSHLALNPVTPKILQTLLSNKRILRVFYGKSSNAKYVDVKDTDGFDKMMDMESVLWATNDIRTQAYTTLEMFRLDNCTRQIDLPVWHIYSPSDNYFDHTYVEQHFRIIFSNYEGVPAKGLKHSPSVIATAEETEVMVPPKLRKVFLAKLK